MSPLPTLYHHLKNFNFQWDSESDKINKVEITEDSAGALKIRQL